MLIQIQMIDVGLAGTACDFRVEVVGFFTDSPLCKDLARDRLAQGDTPGCGILFIVSAPPAPPGR
jgi:hypothetical protein